MISVLSKLFEGMCYESFFMFSLIVSVVGTIVLIILLVLTLKEKINLTTSVIPCITIAYLIVKLMTICVDKNKEITYETYKTNLEKGYTVYLNGEEVTQPDKMILDGYEIDFNDEDKEILLHKSGE